MKRKPTFIQLTALLCCTVRIACGQPSEDNTDSEEYRRIQITSPQVADMIKFDRAGDVNENSGRLDFNVDILHWEDPDFELPIRIKYNSEGFKPNAIENYVGRDWSLECGGIVYRDIKGLPDDIYVDDLPRGEFGTNRIYGFVKTASSGKDQESVERKLYADPRGETFTFYGSKVPVFRSEPSQEISSDIYYFRFGRHSGKFMINYDGSTEVVSFSGGKYRVLLGGYQMRPLGDLNEDYTSNITILTDDGYSYTFGGCYGAVEFTALNWLESADILKTLRETTKVMAWGLSEVVAPNGRKLKFTYKYVPSALCNNPKTLPNDTNAIRDGYHRNFMLMCSPFSRTYYKIIPFYNANWFNVGTYWVCDGYNYTLNKIMLIDRIETDDKTVQFHYSDRDESPYNAQYGTTFGQRCGAKLDSVTLTSARKIVESTKFTYTFMGRRMFLQEAANSRQGTYRFTYHYPTSVDLFTKDIDHWGYYRYTKPNTELVPEVRQDSLSRTHALVYLDDNREPMPSESDYTLGMMTCVTFPTGGTMEIEYEPHTYSSVLEQHERHDFLPALRKTDGIKLGGGVRVKRLVYDAGDGNKSQTLYLYGEDPNPDAPASSGILLYKPRYHHYNRTVNQNTSIRSFDVFNSNGFNPRTYASDHIRYSVVTKVDLDSYALSEDSIFLFSLSPLTDCTAPVSRQVYVGDPHTGIPHWRELEKSYATWTISGNSDPDGNGYSVAQIKRSSTVVREYRFEGPDPVRDYIFNPTEELEEGPYTVSIYKTGRSHLTFKARYPQTGRTKLEASGYTVKRYTDYATNPDHYTDAHSFRTAIRYPIRNYTAAPELDTVYFKNCFRSPEDYSVERGKLLCETLLDKEMRPVRRTDYTYERIGFDRYGIYVSTPVPVGNVQVDMYSHLNKERFYMYLPTCVTTTDYFGADSMVTVERSEYDAFGTLKSVQTVNSNGERKRSEWRRAGDTSDTEGVYALMRGRNMLSPVLSLDETVTAADSTRHRSGYRVEYGIYPHPDFFRGIPFPQRVSRFSDEASAERIRYLAYDRYGNPVHLIRDSTLHEVYLWSYVGKYPVAKIENATYDEVAGALDIPVDELADTWYFTTQEVDKLRDRLPDARVWTYSYSPLIGMSSATDPSGRTTVYTYDDAGRLTHTLLLNQANELEVLQRNEYHLRNQ